MQDRQKIENLFFPLQARATGLSQLPRTGTRIKKLYRLVKQGKD